MQSHPEQSDEPPNGRRRSLVLGVLIAVVIVVLVLLHLLGVIHG